MSHLRQEVRVRSTQLMGQRAQGLTTPCWLGPQPQLYGPHVRSIGVRDQAHVPRNGSSA